MGDFFGLSAADDIGFVEQAVNQAIGGLYGVDASIADGTNAAIGDVWGALSAFPVGMSQIWQTVEKIWHDLWAGNFKGLLTDLVALIHEIEQDLKYILQPLINWIKFEKAWLDMMYNQVIKPLLNLIQRIRQTLVIFRLLHIGWATSLDQWLANLEGRISQAFLQARQDINTLANWVNYIVDPSGLFNVPLMLLTQLQTIPQLWAALANIPSVLLGAADQQAQATAAASGTKAGAQADINARVGGNTSADLTRYTQIQALYQGDGYTV